MEGKRRKEKKRIKGCRLGGRRGMGRGGKDENEWDRESEGTCQREGQSRGESDAVEQPWAVCKNIGWWFGAIALRHVCVCKQLCMHMCVSSPASLPRLDCREQRQGNPSPLFALPLFLSLLHTVFLSLFWVFSLSVSVSQSHFQTFDINVILVNRGCLDLPSLTFSVCPSLYLYDCLSFFFHSFRLYLTPSNV